MPQRQLSYAFARQTRLNDDSIGPLLLHCRKSSSSSSALLFITASIAIPVAWPRSRICSRKSRENGSGALANAATRRADGNNSWTNSTLLPANSAPTLDIPVTFPPGRARLSTSPLSTGFPASAMTTEMSRVACFAARAAGVNQATMISTLSRTSSATNSGRRLALPCLALPCLALPCLALPCLHPIETQIECFAPRRNPTHESPLGTAARIVQNPEPELPEHRWLALSAAVRVPQTADCRAADERDELSPLHWSVSKGCTFLGLNSRHVFCG